MIATYNERQSLPTLVAQIHEYLPTATILVVDDNSPDGTGDWVRELSRSDQRIQLLHRESKQGLGVATTSGIKLALSQQPSWIATMDADLSHQVRDLQKLWTAATSDQHDVIIGSRYVPGGRIENWSLRRRLASRAVNWFARWALWLKTRDNSIAFRIYRADALRKIDLDRVDCPGYAYLEQILVHLKRSGAIFFEVPVVFVDRAAGDSKVTVSELFRNLKDIVGLAFRRH